MLELTSISKSFADALVLDDLNLTVAPGSRTAIVGPSGSGKTTLLRILAGFETPDAGRIVMQGKRCLMRRILFRLISVGLALFRRKGRCSRTSMWRIILPGAGRHPAGKAPAC
jgi:ABC-type Fe3+/spermidine/putrescine transport system ATPase subunit